MPQYEEIEFECIQGVKGKQHYIAGRRYKMSRQTMENIGAKFFREAGAPDPAASKVEADAREAQERQQAANNARWQEARRALALKEAEGQARLAEEEARRAQILQAQAEERKKTAEAAQAAIPHPHPNLVAPPPPAPAPDQSDPPKPQPKDNKPQGSHVPRAERLKDASV